ncbi:diguanylate cyclase [Pseudomonadota bacterium]
MFPALLVAAGLALFVSRPQVPVPLGAALDFAPYILALVGAVLGGWFKSPRVVLMAALIAFAHWVVQIFVPVLPVEDARGDEIFVLFAALAVLFPLNAGLIAIKPDRALLSRAVLGRVVFFAVQVLIVIAVWDASDVAHRKADALLHTRLVEQAFDAWSLLPQPAIGLFIVVGLGLLIRAAMRGGAIDGGMFGAMAASALALHAAGQGHVPAIMFSLALLGLLGAVVQESYRLAFIDELTNLPGRRALMHALQSAGGRYTVAMLDVDHFKKFNDTYGHDVGDQVLKLVASKMMKVTGGGRAFRYGGEEFTVLFTRRSLDEAVVHLDKLREAIAQASFQLRAEDRPKEKPAGPKSNKKTAQRTAQRTALASDTVSVTISIGASAREDGQKPDLALKAADQALYRAKDGGRNQVSV